MYKEANTWMCPTLRDLTRTCRFQGLPMWYSILIFVNVQAQDEMME